ncbi:MAG: YnfA family protein [Bacteroidales bacterium]
MKIIYSILIFILAGLCEIGGGYLVWLWLREQKPWWFGAIGGVWGWKVDGFIPDRYDIIGGLVALNGMGIIMYAQ